MNEEERGTCTQKERKIQRDRQKRETEKDMYLYTDIKRFNLNVTRLVEVP